MPQLARTLRLPTVSGRPCCPLQGILPGLPGLPALVTALDRSWSSEAARQEPTAPALVYSLSQLEEQLKKAYRTVTEGKFRCAVSVSYGFAASPTH